MTIKSFLLAVLIIFSLWACGDESDEDSNTNPSSYSLVEKL